VPDLEVEVRSVGLWRMNVTVAERLVAGRVVLCGDAAHQFPPTGGLGVNTGLQGMHNAMWKLALCVQGVANWSLLETYNAERRAPALRTARQSLENHRNVGRIAAAAYNPSGSDMETSEVIRESHRYGNHLGVEFGTRYESTAVIPDGSEPPGVEDTYSDYAPSATPGCRAPHVWLGSDTEQVSTLDLFGAGFTVLTGPDGEVWHEAAGEAFRTLHTPIACYTIGTPGLADFRNVFFDQYGITDDGAVLVRPDGYVAWRSATGNSDGAPLFDAVDQILGLRH
jgi:putative polyketide hydroxylase